MLMKSCKLLLKVGLTTILVALIFLCCVIGKINVYAADISTYSANDRAEMKGFTLNNLGYGTDWSKEAVSILDYGTMSLWIAQFTTPDPDKQRARYVTVLVEARLSANGKTGYGTFNNDLMDIEIGRKLDTNTSIVCYAPIQTDSQYTVTESFGASAGTGSGLSIGYSYQTSKTYSDISFTNYTNRKEFEGKTLGQICRELEADEDEALIYILGQTGGQASMIYYALCEEDLRTFMKHPACMIGTDAFARDYSGPTAAGRPHPQALRFG